MESSYHKNPPFQPFELTLVQQLVFFSRLQPDPKHEHHKSPEEKRTCLSWQKLYIQTSGNQDDRLLRIIAFIRGISQILPLQ